MQEHATPRVIYKFTLDLSRANADHRQEDPLSGRIDVPVPPGTTPLYVAGRHAETYVCVETTPGLEQTDMLHLAAQRDNVPFEHSGRYLGTVEVGMLNTDWHIYHLTDEPAER